MDTLERLFLILAHTQAAIGAERYVGACLRTEEVLRERAAKKAGEEPVRARRVYEIRKLDGVDVVLSYNENDLRRYRASYPGCGATGFTLDEAIRASRARWESYGRPTGGSVSIPPGWEKGTVE